jgi:RNA polymerase sigma factor (sigma-70 family)
MMPERGPEGKAVTGPSAAERIAQLTDGQLLGEYAARGAPEAFAEIVSRHAGMVYAACLRVVGEAHAAEDAAQAAFLVLVRKARSLPRGTVLSVWLFRTAEQVSRDALKLAQRRRRHESEAAAMRESTTPERQVEGAPAGAALNLDAALAALPAAQRDVIVLRYLRDKPEAEICRELGCPQSTVASRLARGLERLREKLGARGATVSTAALGGLLASEMAPAAPPAALLATLKGLGAGAASASVSASAISLAEGTMKAMMIAKLKLAAAVIGATVVVGGGGGAVALKLAAAEPAAPPAQPRNAKLKDLPANTWVKIAAKFGRNAGAAEVPWCYDPDGRRLVRVGGCTETYSNEVWSYDLGADAWTCNLPYVKKDPQDESRAPSDRPGKGCNRGICYDRDTKCIWSWGGATSDGGPGNLFGLWKGTGKLGAGDWQRFEVPTIEQAMIAYDEGAKKLVCTSQHWVALHAGTFQTMIVDPATGKAETLKARIDSPELVAAAKAKVEAKTWSSGKPAEFQSLIYVPDLGGVLFTTSFPWNWGETRKDPEAAMVTWVYNLKENVWKDLKPKASPPWRSSHSTSCDSKNHIVLLYGGVTALGAPPGEHHRPLNDTWAYLVKENTWVEMKPKASPYAQDGAMLMAYDPEHDVHVVGKYFGNWPGSVWVYRYSPAGDPAAGQGK